MFDELTIADLDLLVRVYDAGVNAGMGRPHADGPDTELLDRVRERWHDQHEADEPPLLRDEVPGWLLAHAERQALERR